MIYAFKLLFNILFTRPQCFFSVFRNLICIKLQLLSNYYPDDNNLCKFVLNEEPAAPGKQIKLFVCPKCPTNNVALGSSEKRVWTMEYDPSLSSENRCVYHAKSISLI